MYTVVYLQHIYVTQSDKNIYVPSLQVWYVMGTELQWKSRDYSNK